MIKFDISRFDAGSVVILGGATIKGKEWLAEHMPEDCLRWGQGGYVIEPRFLHDIIIGAMDDGLEVEE